MNLNVSDSVNQQIPAQLSLGSIGSSSVTQNIQFNVLEINTYKSENGVDMLQHCSNKTIWELFLLQ